MRAAALLLLVTLGVGVASAKDWRFDTYADADWGYRVQVPARERPSKEARVSRYGPAPEQSTAAHTARFAPSGVDAVLTVTVVEIPPQLRDAPASVLYDGAKRGLVGPAGFGMTLAAQDGAEFATPSGTVPGKAFRLFDGKHHVRARVVAFEGRLYQLTAVGTEEAVSGKASVEFLTKLTLTGRGKP